MIVPTRRLIWFMVPGLVLLILPALIKGSLPIAVVYFVALALIALADALLSFAPRIPLSVTRKHAPLVSLNSDSPFELNVENETPRQLTVWVQDDLPLHWTSETLGQTATLGAGEHALFRYHAKAQERGRFEFGQVRTRISSPIRLWERQLIYDVPTQVRVFPNIQLMLADTLRSQQNQLKEWGVRRVRQLGEGTDFDSLREYTRQDSYRSIDWKSSAKWRKLLVRQHRQENNQRVLFMLDAGWAMGVPFGSLSAFDHALNAVLQLSQVAIRNQDYAGVMAFHNEPLFFLKPERGQKQLERMLHVMHDVRTQPVLSDYHRAFSQLNGQYRRRSLLVVMTNLIDEHSTERIIKHVAWASRRHRVLVTVLRDPRLSQALHTVPQTDEDRFSLAAAVRLLDESSRFVSRLEDHGVLVLHVEPEELAARLINEYLKIRARGEA